MPDLDRASSDAIEPSVSELLLYRRTLDDIERMSVEDLRRICGILARQALVVQPAALRWLARDAAGNLSSHWKGGAALALEMGFGPEE
jgi:SNF2 family DNA or RNA helicase